ncbi:hypothetical protein GCM10008939_02520 [Deinococcus aquiradiocola]|uniref:Uncharacterized protein n=1 Tax=Deinococcus aquiradiocola TaxID=393059 RepID=A0A917P5D6_9DEIO|nr:hypothetical protein GCM10008939_02520 [Deinococcus aquiradiocola]
MPEVYQRRLTGVRQARAVRPDLTPPSDLPGLPDLNSPLLASGLPRGGPGAPHQHAAHAPHPGKRAHFTLQAML